MVLRVAAKMILSKAVFFIIPKRSDIRQGCNLNPKTQNQPYLAPSIIWKQPHSQRTSVGKIQLHFAKHTSQIINIFSFNQVVSSEQLIMK
jgi:hypothetical protein